MLNKWWLSVAGILAVAVLAGGYTMHEREVGALRERLKVATLQHTADSLLSVQTAAVAVLATRKADSLRAIFRREQAHDAVVSAAVDSTVKHLATVRDSALVVARDSAATTGQLRSELVRVVSASDSAEVAHQAEREALRAQLRRANQVIITDSTAIARGIVATNAALARATSSEREVAIMKKALPSGTGNLLRAAVPAAAVYAACHFLVKC